MKILITGNSQASGLKSGYDIRPDILDEIADVYFYVVVGGEGPAFKIENGSLVTKCINLNSKYPPWTYPKGLTLSKIHDYDVIVISALGYIDGACYFSTPVTRQGLVYDFQPKRNSIIDAYVSKACYRQVIHSYISKHPGVQFLISLRQHYDGIIILQPFPLISDAVIDDPEWPLNEMYKDPLDAHRFFCKIRDAFLMQMCEKHSVELLPYPRSEWLHNCLTPKELMSPIDGIHAGSHYGIMVMKQIVDVIRKIK